VIDVGLQALLLERRNAAPPARPGFMEDDELGSGLRQRVLQRVQKNLYLTPSW
jgi:hypothetical protein